MKTALWFRRLPWSVVAIALGLIVCGWLAVARAEAFREDLVGGSSRYVGQQVVFSLLALAAMFAVARLDYQALCRLSYPLFVAAVGLLVAVFFFPPINNARRWIRIGAIGLQPAEFAKLAYVLALARYLMHRDNYRRLRGLMAPLAVTLLPVALILKEPDLGMAMVFWPLLFIMLWIAGARRRDLAVALVAGLAALPLLWTQMSREQRSRVTALFDQPAADQRPSDEAYHLHQAKRMLALGGVWGSLVAGPLSDDPADYQLPEARNDFIFCVVGERFGLWGLGMVLSLYGLLAWRGAAIAAAAREPFGRLAAAGVTAMIAVQTLINVGMNLGLLPITGLSLPLVSYGGSGLLAHGAALGLLLSVGSHPAYEVGPEPFRFRDGPSMGRLKH